MSSEITQAPEADLIKQFSVFAENKVGRLNEFVNLLASHRVHVLALTTMETTESAILHVIVDDPDEVRALFFEHAFPFTESDLLAVELGSENGLTEILGALNQAEINIHYIYPLIIRPNEKAALAMNLEDNDLAAHALRVRGITLLTQSDLSR